MPGVGGGLGISRRTGEGAASTGRSRGQALTEFALVATVFFLLFFGVVDIGRMVATHAAVITASREAARYGSAVGLDDSGTVPRYLHCQGIRDAARRTTASVVTLTDASIHIAYDNGSGASTGASECNPSPGPTPDPATIDALDRVVVTVTVTYAPVSPLRLLIGPTTVQSIARRTIVKAP